MHAAIATAAKGATPSRLRVLKMWGPASQSASGPEHGADGKEGAEPLGLRAAKQQRRTCEHDDTGRQPEPLPHPEGCGSGCVERAAPVEHRPVQVCGLERVEVADPAEPLRRVLVDEDRRPEDQRDRSDDRRGGREDTRRCWRAPRPEPEQPGNDEQGKEVVRQKPGGDAQGEAP